MTRSAVAPPSPFRVALTFDAEHADRPSGPGVTARILDALGEVGVAATFFVQGRWAEAEPGLARRIATEGHLVGSHSHHHARLTLLTSAGIVRDARAAQAAIVATTGCDPRPWYRCPFGAGAGSPRVVAALDRAGYVDVGWDVDGLDWAGPSPARLRGRVVRGVLAAGDAAVVLLHGWPVATAAALPLVLGDLRAAGAQFVRIDELGSLPGRRPAAAVAAAT